METPQPPDEVLAPTGPNLLSTRAIDREVETWHLTGVFPFPRLGLDSFRQFHGLSVVDLRLVHHLCSIHQDMQLTGLTKCALWVQELPRYKIKPT